MPTVVMRWEPDVRPTAVPESLVEFLTNGAGMDRMEALGSVRNLMRGKVVEAFFDLGENEAANAFKAKLDAWGINARIRSDSELEKSERNERRKSWLTSVFFLGISLIGAIILERWYAVVLSALVLGGLVSSFVIRRIRAR